MDRLFGSFLAPYARERGNGTLVPAFVPRLDVTDTEKEIKVSVELPGLDEKDVSVDLEDNVLTISGEKKYEEGAADDGQRHVECCYGSFSRTIGLTSEVDAAKVKATFKKGILDVVLPKVRDERPKRKTIEVKAA